MSVDILETADKELVDRATIFVGTRTCNGEDGPCLRCVVQFARQETRSLVDHLKRLKEKNKRLRQRLDAAKRKEPATRSYY